MSTSLTDASTMGMLITGFPRPTRTNVPPDRVDCNGEHHSHYGWLLSSMHAMRVIFSYVLLAFVYDNKTCITIGNAAKCTPVAMVKSVLAT